MNGLQWVSYVPCATDSAASDLKGHQQISAFLSSNTENYSGTGECNFEMANDILESEIKDQDAQILTCLVDMSEKDFY